MPIDRQYILKHKSSKHYITEDEKNGYRIFNNQNKWLDNILDENLIYSYRKNKYTKKTFTEGLHAHDYYELIIYINGDVEYVKDDILIAPKPFSAVWFLPGQMHTARLKSASEYERYVFYFSKDFFKFNNIIADMTKFTENTDIFSINPEINKLKDILNKIQKQFDSNKNYNGLLAKAYITELFDILNTNSTDMVEATILNDEMMQIKNYIDENYQTISSTSEIAKAFHYSREHLSRKFKETFNISISEYISKRRILESIPLLSKMRGADAAYTVGFKSQSAYIAAFVKNTGYLPSEYKKQK